MSSAHDSTVLPQGSHQLTGWGQKGLKGRAGEAAEGRSIRTSEALRPTLLTRLLKWQSKSGPTYQALTHNYSTPDLAGNL